MKHLKIFFDYFSQAVGYDTLGDMLISVFMIKGTALTIGVFLASLSASFILFFESYVYSPVFGYVVFILASLGESVFGTYASIKVDGERFDLDKALRIIPKFLSHTFFLSLAWHMGVVQPIALAWLAPTIWFYLTTMNFLKGYRNAGRMKWVEGRFVDYLEKQFSDRYNLMNYDNEGSPKKDNAIRNRGEHQ